MPEQKLAFCTFQEPVGICKLDAGSSIPPWACQGTFFSITKTADELSIVCPVSAIPENVVQEKNWRILKIQGTLDFSLVGILAQVSTVLAAAGLSIFAVSTYNTDYILVREREFDTAVDTLTLAGHAVLPG